MKDDGWIEERIFWKARQHNLPAHQTFAFSALPTTYRDRLIAVATMHWIGKPVLAFIADDTRWTLLGTRRIISNFDGRQSECAFADIDQICPHDRNRPKDEREHLSLKNRNGEQTTIWVPRGLEFFALWSVLLMLVRLERGDVALEARVSQVDAFRDLPWKGKSTEEWNRSVYWDQYYRDLLAATDASRRDSVIHREVDLLIQMLVGAGEFQGARSQTVMDAGCGISLIPHLLAYWGFQVTAVDSCASAIEWASQHHSTDEDLARCVPILDPTDLIPGARVVVDSPARSLKRLRNLRAPGGSVTYLAGDWFSSDLRPATVGVIYCRNSLRQSTKPYWRRTLSRFHELLSAGGVLLLENVNAIEIQDEVEELLMECGFLPLAPGAGRETSTKYVIDMWPTG